MGLGYGIWTGTTCLVKGQVGLGYGRELSRTWVWRRVKFLPWYSKESSGTLEGYRLR